MIMRLFVPNAPPLGSELSASYACEELHPDGFCLPPSSPIFHQD